MFVPARLSKNCLQSCITQNIWLIKTNWTMFCWGKHYLKNPVNGLQLKIKEVLSQTVFFNFLAHCLNEFSTTTKLQFQNIARFLHVNGLIRIILQFHQHTNAVNKIQTPTSNGHLLPITNQIFNQLFIEIMSNPISNLLWFGSDTFVNKFNNFEFTLLADGFNNIFGLC